MCEQIFFGSVVIDSAGAARRQGWPVDEYSEIALRDNDCLCPVDAREMLTAAEVRWHISEDAQIIVDTISPK